MSLTYCAFIPPRLYVHLCVSWGDHTYSSILQRRGAPCPTVSLRVVRTAEAASVLVLRLEY